MKTITTLFLLILIPFFTFCQQLYIKTFGNQDHRALIYLHGGPGYNSANFEYSTAQALADKGFFVIVYDRRGEGRSPDGNARFTFRETFDDLNSIYQRYSLKKASLIGHSFGGMIATFFARQYSDRVASIVLVGAPVSVQQTCKTIIATSRDIYQQKKDTVRLRYLSMVEKMDTTGIEYSSYCLTQAIQNGFYNPKKMSDESRAIRQKIRNDTVAYRYATQNSFQAPQGFWKNEHYTTLDLTADLENVKKRGVGIFALYGKDDGLYSVKQVTELQDIVGDKNLKYLEDCSHNVFIDQQKTFIEAISKWAK